MTRHARAERDALCDTFTLVGPDAPTLCSPWLTKDLAAHLVIRERRPDLAAGMFASTLASRLDAGMESYAARPWLELVDLVRSGPPAFSPTRVGAVDEAVNLVEMVVHHEDVLRGDGAVGPQRVLDPDLEQAVWDAVRRMARLMFRKAKVGVELVAPDFGRITAHSTPDAGAASATEAVPRVTLTGAPLELLLTSYGRGRAAQTTTEGPESAVASLGRTDLGLG